MSWLKRFCAIAFALTFTLGLSACGDTWDGIKKDSKENAEAAGEAIEDAGEKVQDAVK